eukprot:3761449-Rhodomonas_salina.3
MASASNKGKPTDLYKVLGVPRGAGEAQIKSAYRKLAIQYHPDKTAGDEEVRVSLRMSVDASDLLASRRFPRLFESGDIKHPRGMVQPGRSVSFRAK